jgi:hypothetical protein
MEIHACNPSYSGGRDRRIMVQDQSRQKMSKTVPKNKLGMVVHASQLLEKQGEEDCYLRLAWAKAQDPV